MCEHLEVEEITGVTIEYKSGRMTSSKVIQRSSDDSEVWVTFDDVITSLSDIEPIEPNLEKR